MVNVERQRRYTYPEYHRLTNRIANMVRDSAWAATRRYGAC